MPDKFLNELRCSTNITFEENRHEKSVSIFPEKKIFPAIDFANTVLPLPDDPVMAGFAENQDRINKLGDDSPGCVWRAWLKTYSSSSGLNS